MMNTSPLALPRFSEINPATIESDLSILLRKHRATVDEICKTHKPITWETLMQPLEALDDELHQFWSPISHLHSVSQSEPLRQAYNACLPALTAYSTERMQNKKIYDAVMELKNSAVYEEYDQIKKQIIAHVLRDFHLAGVDLSPDNQKKFLELQQALGQATTTFSQNILDATEAWTLQITDQEVLQGLSDQALNTARAAAVAQKKEGWLLTLHQPCYTAVMMQAENRELRKKLYEVYTTRASDQGPHAGKWDNTPIIQTILTLRHEIAVLLGFKNYAQYSLETKMATSPEEVLDFLNNLVSSSYEIAKKEYAELKAFAKKIDAIELEPWDLSFYSEKWLQENFSVSDEILCPYYPVPKVMTGLFNVVNKLYGISLKLREGVDTWHPSVLFYDIFDENNMHIGGCYMDLYARNQKRDGAWMDNCVDRRLLRKDNIQLPVAYLNCNFNPPSAEHPALLTHNDVMTLFHEFGHCLHHLLTKINHSAVSGINGVLWDAVELPSQFMENFCFEKEVMMLVSGHYKTGEPLPDDLFQKMKGARYFQAAMQMIRQLQFSLFDFILHQTFDPTQENAAQTVLNTVRQRIAVVPVPVWNRFQHSFSHIFSGGYAAGYYSYAWAEVLSSDAYSKFEEEGLFNPVTGRSFLKNILEKGGSQAPMDLFVAFRGRKPTIDALLRHHGLM